MFSISTNHFVTSIFLIFEKHFICIISHFPFKFIKCNYWIGMVSITFSLPERISKFWSVLLCLSRILDWESIWASILISFESILMEVNRSELALKTNIKPRWMDGWSSPWSFTPLRPYHSSAVSMDLENEKYH